ncbi:MAG TPA: carboxypeptidase regulatory-like domain-containing protein [Pyrinomonadaceae bacterium]|nr:carboxypeptidase regulatory-like domain-containing protein [Pyrinomonadaceae bacterium]
MRILNTTIIAAFLLLCSSITIQAQTFGGEAAAVRVTVTTPATPVLTTSVADTGTLPAPGGNIVLTGVGTNIPNILTLGDATVRTSGGPLAVPTTPNSSQSLSSINSLNVGILNGLNLTAGVIASSTSCSCPARACVGTSTIANLTLTDALGNVTTINGTAAPNTSINVFAVGGGLIGTVILNEQIISPGSITVNSIHIRVTILGIVTDVIVTSAHSDITCVMAPLSNLYSGRATGIRNRERTVGGVDLTTLVSDTGFLPTSGGKVNVSTLGTTVLPGLLTSGTVTANTYGGAGGAPTTTDGSSASDARVQNLGVNLGLLAVTADAVSSNTRCTCSLAAPTCTGDSILANLRITVLGLLNLPIAVSVPPNTIISLDFGLVDLGSIGINEQFVTPPSPSVHPENITVNALHLRLNVLGLALSDTTVASSHSDIDCATSASAAGASISGRVTDGNGRGLSRTMVTMTDGEGYSNSAITNTFGYYTLRDVPVGRLYFVTPSSKQYNFLTRAVSHTSDLAGFDFSPDLPPVGKIEVKSKR